MYLSITYFANFVYAFTSHIVQIKQISKIDQNAFALEFTSHIVQIKPVVDEKDIDEAMVHIPHSSDQTFHN